MSNQQPGPGWYQDPQNPQQQRYWDGIQWAQGSRPSPVSNYGPPVQPPAKKSHAGLFILIVVGVIVLLRGLGGIAAIAGLASDNGGSSSASASNHHKPRNDHPRLNTAAPQPAQKAKVVLRGHGNGASQTKAFVVQGDWDLRYSYSCGSVAIVQIFLYSKDGQLSDVLANTQKPKDQVTTHQHAAHGAYYLKWNTGTCNYQFTVIDIPG